MRSNYFKLLLFSAINLFGVTFLSSQEVIQPVSSSLGGVYGGYTLTANIFCDSSKNVFLSQYSTLERISADLTDSSYARISMSIPGIKKPQSVFNCVLFSEKLFAFSTFSKDDIHTVYESQIDKNNFSQIGIPQKVFEYSVDGINNNQLPNDIFYHPVQIKVSQNGEYLVIFAFQSSQGKSTDYIHSKIFHNDFSEYWEKNIVAPFGTSSFSMTDLQLFDNGTLMITGYDTYDKGFSKIAKKKNRPNYMYHILTLAEHSDDMMDRKIDADSIFIKSLKAGMTNDGGIVGCGFYSQNDDDLIGGIYYVSYKNNSMEKSIFRTSLFTKEFMVAEMPESDFSGQNNNPKGMKDYQTRKMFLLNDGSVTILAEQIYTANKGGNSYICSGDIILVNLNQDGSLSWQQRIYKKQKGDTFFATAYNDQLLIFYNDNNSNAVSANSMSLQLYEAGKKCHLMCVTINPDGAFNKQVVSSFTDSPQIDSFLQTSESEYVFWTQFSGFSRTPPANTYALKIGQ